MKKFVHIGVLFCSVLAVFALTAGFSPAVKAAGESLLGDVNLDGNVTVTDALTVLRGGVGFGGLSVQQQLQADVDGDGVPSVTDALSVLRYAVGLTSTFSIPTYSAHTNGTNVRLRSAPILEDRYIILEMEQQGTSLTVFGNAIGNWYRVQMGSVEGYCSADYVTVDNVVVPSVPSIPPMSLPTTPSVPSDSARFAMTTDSLNFRSGPGTNYDVLATISSGTVIVVIGEQQNGFYPVCYYQRVSVPQDGWCSADYITFTLHAELNTRVRDYEPTIRKYAEQYGIPEYVELIQAVMMQESSGSGSDPMQAAEGAYNKLYPHVPNGITDPAYSIECGVQELKSVLLAAGVQGPRDIARISLALQGYNFGPAYISWARETYGGYSYANAVEFSDRMAARPNWPYSIYGDKLYVPHVLRYYPYS